MPGDNFAIYGKNPLCFRVTNIHPEKRIVEVFGHPLFWGQTKDLMQYVGITEPGINTSLLKGELHFLISKGAITVECSDINLITFNPDQLAFLTMAGIYTGTTINSNLDFSFRYNFPLIGATDGVNRIYNTTETFIYGTRGQHFFRPQVFHNSALKIGGLLNENVRIGNTPIGNMDYLVERSSVTIPPGLYDQIRFISFTPNYQSKIVATYAVAPN